MSNEATPPPCRKPAEPKAAAPKAAAAKAAAPKAAAAKAAAPKAAAAKPAPPAVASPVVETSAATPAKRVRKPAVKKSAAAAVVADAPAPSEVRISSSVTAAAGSEGLSGPTTQSASHVTGPSEEEFERVIGGAHHDPHSILGVHPQSDGSTVVRTLRHDARSVDLLHDGDIIPFTHTYGGVWSVVLPGAVGDYRLQVSYGPDATYVVDDPYRWLPTLGDIDLHLIGEGRHEQLWDVLGAHPRTYETPNGQVNGTSFAVWAPNAAGVRVSGDFDYWTGAGQPMRSLGSTGVWEIFLPDVNEGTRYKFQILGADRVWRDKADPMAFYSELPPQTASIVFKSTYEWNDAAWISERAAKDQLASPMSIYEMHVGSWKKGLNYRELAEALIADLAETGFTHVEFLPLEGHPFDGSWGYQVTSYYAADCRYGDPDDLRFLIDRLHQAGIGVILDWVPAHFPKDAFALARFDGTPLYEHADPRRGEQPDWGTYVFDFGRREVRNFLVANALFWLEEFHLDGLRVDAVASMLYLDYSREEGQWYPNEFGGRENLQAVAFLQEVNATVGKRVPGALMIAEESTAWPGVTKPTYLGGLGFHLKWNMGWMHDTLEYLAREPVHRSWHHDEMTFSMMYAYSEQFVLPISHDEVVHGKGSMWGKVAGDSWRKAATLRTYFTHMWAHPGKQLLFMGSEIGAFDEWTEKTSLPWWLLDHPLHAGVRKMIGDLNAIYKSTPALYTQDFTPAGFTWLDGSDRNGNVFSYLRWGSDGSVVAVILNFSTEPHNWYKIGLPRAGKWREALNSDSEVYGGSGTGNMGVVHANDEPSHGQPASATIVVPPLGALLLIPDNG